MFTTPVHHRAKHGSRARRLAMPAAVVLGLTLASQWSNPFDSAFWSPAQAEVPVVTSSKVQPRVVDFGKLAKQKAEARRLMDAARKAAARGDLETARRHADQAATIPVEWNLGETTPKKFLDDLEADPSRFSAANNDRARTEATKETPRHRTAPASDRDVIELAFPNDRAGAAEETDEDLSLMDAPPALKVPGTTQPRDIQAPSTFKPESTGTAPRNKSRFAPIPTLTELADPTPVTETPATMEDEVAAPSFEPPVAANTKPSADEPRKPELARTQRNTEPGRFEPRPIRSLASDDIAIPSGRLEETEFSDPALAQPSPRHSRGTASETTPTTVIHEFRISDRSALQDQAASSSVASQLLLNINALLIAGLFGALLLLVVVAVVVLRKFGPNPQFTFKVELSHPLGVSVAAPASAEKPAVPPIAVTPIYALKRQMEEELEQQQEDAMMRQVFEDNLKLRDQLEETRIAA